MLTPIQYTITTTGRSCSGISIVCRDTRYIAEKRTRSQKDMAKLCGPGLTGIRGYRKECCRDRHDVDIRELDRLEAVWNEAYEHGGCLETLWVDEMVAVPKMPGAQICSFRRMKARKLLDTTSGSGCFLKRLGAV